MARSNFGAFAALVLAGVSALAPPVARADASCDALITRLQQAVWQKPAAYIDVLWTTNYYVRASKQRFMAQTWIQLKAGPPALQASGPLGPSLGGQAERKMKFVHFLGDHASSLYDKSEVASLRIQTDGKIRLNDIWGPFDPVCSGDFAILNNGESVEVFNFAVDRSDIIR